MLLGIVMVAAVASAAAVIWASRGIICGGANSDAAKQLRAAAASSRWRWPSHMHDHAGGKAYMKDVGVLGLALCQRLLRDRETFVPLVAWCAAAQAASIVLLHVVAGRYWGEPAGAVTALLYGASFWPYLIVLQGGFQGVSLMCLLWAVLCLQRAEAAGPAAAMAWDAGSGACAALMMFASASSRKFLPFVAAAFLYRHRAALEPLWPLTGAGSIEASRGAWTALVIALLASAASVMLVAGGGERVIEALSAVSAPIRARQRRLREILERRRGQLATCASMVALVCLGGWLIARDASVYRAVTAWILGAGAVAGLLLAPEPARHLKGYWNYWMISTWHDHFALYDAHFTRLLGRIVRTSAGGWRWYARFFRRMAPWHALAFAVLVVAHLAILARHGWPARELAASTAMALLCLSPILWSELTKGPKAALPYFPALPALVWWVGYLVWSVQRGAGLEGAAAWWIIVGVSVSVTAMWNLRVFATDIWPSKMATAWLSRRLATLAGQPLYTYATPFNDLWVGALPEALRERCGMRTITRLAEVSDGYVIVPPTSGKSSDFQSSVVGPVGDFRDDPELTRLIESGQIRRYALEEFRTPGASPYWAQIGDVASFRDLIVGEVTALDRWRGRAWILDGRALAEARRGATAAQPGAALQPETVRG